MLDLLSDILTRLDVRGTLYFRTSLTPPWGVRVPDYAGVARFHYAHRGECLVRVAATGEVRRLAQGDLAIIPHGGAHSLFCTPETESAALPVEEVVARSGYNGTGVLVWGGGDETRETQLICGHVSFAPGGRHPIFQRLPACLLIRNYGETAGAWMEASLRLIGAEAGGARLGGDLVALKMSEAIFAQAIRHFLETAGAEDAALSAFADPRLARALTAFHRDPARAWTVGELARMAAMSRTGFAAAFAAKLGMTPMAYATLWRMQIASQALARERVSVAEAAERAGYNSEAAFSRVFRREVGLPPATYRAQA